MTSTSLGTAYYFGLTYIAQFLIDTGGIRTFEMPVTCRFGILCGRVKDFHTRRLSHTYVVGN